MSFSSHPLKIFVYGSLKRGFAYHDDYCHGALSIEPASVRGTLFEHPSGFPVVAVDRGDILALGTSDPAVDFAIQKAHVSAASIARAHPQLTATSRSSGRLKIVRGELMSFTDPQARLPAMDELEGFRPGEITLYQRVLVLVHPDSGHPVPAWMYVLGMSREKLKRLHSSSWTTSCGVLSSKS